MTSPASGNESGTEGGGMSPPLANSDGCVIGSLSVAVLARGRATSAGCFVLAARPAGGDVSAAGPVEPQSAGLDSGAVRAAGASFFCASPFFALRSQNGPNRPGLSASVRATGCPSPLFADSAGSPGPSVLG